jgi:hypothetical protein
MTHLCRSLLALVLLWGPLVAVTAPPATRRTWELSLFTWIRRMPAEKGAPANDHPRRVEVATLAKALGSVRFVSGKAEESLFEPSEAMELGRIMAEALALVEPSEDLELLSTSKRNGGLFDSSLAVTARIFLRQGRLNLIVRDTRLDFMGAYNLDFRMPKFRFGSRTEAGAVILRSEGAESPRPDWLVFPLRAPDSTAAPTQSAGPTAVAPPASLEGRLRALKQLREQNLITEEDYTRRKQELLKEI